MVGWKKGHTIKCYKHHGNSVYFNDAIAAAYRDLEAEFLGENAKEYIVLVNSNIRCYQNSDEILTHRYTCCQRYERNMLSDVMEVVITINLCGYKAGSEASLKPSCIWNL